MAAIDRRELAREVEEHTDRYVRAFNSGDADAVNSMYTNEAVAVWEPGKPLAGDERRASVEEFLARKPKIHTKTRHSYVTGDTALLIVDWSIATTTDDGEPELLTGVGVDVLRRDDAGVWRYAVDDPYGDSV
ncbi:YybH family protein [Streptomyces sp. NPDC055103]|uniref:YybH family protein n=1 Tax=Streptomyces sp. NPDC059352 TaxID=3346810 RepID=UPI0036B5C03A